MFRGFLTVCSPYIRTSESGDDCWRSQCAKCKEYFVGDPRDGHQCYRSMTVDNPYCFDPTDRPDCDGKPGPLKVRRRKIRETLILKI